MDDYEAIRQLKARYFRFLDTKDWVGLRRLFCDDVVMDSTGSGGETITGADEFIAFLTPRIAEAITVHHGHTPEIELLSPTTARGIWAMEDLLIWPNGARLNGFGHYHETYEKSDGGWRIKSQELTRLQLDFTPPADA